MIFAPWVHNNTADMSETRQHVFLRCIPTTECTPTFFFKAPVFFLYLNCLGLLRTRETLLFRCLGAQRNEKKCDRGLKVCVYV